MATTDAARPAGSPTTNPTTKEHILAVARQRFAESGFAGTSLNEIADEVGIRRPSLLHHFPSKEDLRRAVLHDALAGWAGLVDGVIDEPRTGWPQVERVLRAAFRYFEEQPDVVRLVREVAWALAYAQGHGVVHRDIKPDNVLLDHAAERGTRIPFGLVPCGSGNDLARHWGTPHDDPEAASFRAFGVSPTAQGSGVGAAVTGGIPFPIPTSGAEAMWNYKMRWVGEGRIDAPAVIIGVAMQGNIAGVRGGGLHNGDVLYLSDSQITNNEATGGEGGGTTEQQSQNSCAAISGQPCPPASSGAVRGRGKWWQPAGFQWPDSSRER